MSLSLSAEQKTLFKIFAIQEQYIIPSYQRPYSWEYDQCFQLYNDLLSAFKSKQDYFIGNIIIAKANDDKDHLEVVDGQQRLITTLLLFKVLFLFQPEIVSLNDLLLKKAWEGVDTFSRIRSDVFEAADGIALNKVLALDLKTISDKLKASLDKNGKLSERKLENKFEINILLFYYWLDFYKQEHDNLKDFTYYLLHKVYLLPIELSGPTQEEANEKALIIFETINDRGLNLEDADIFKAKLYNKAKKVQQEKIFIDLWTDFKNSAERLGFSIDEIFRYYSHIIRGKEGISSSETNLRQFFLKEKFSPLELKQYKDVLDDLMNIIGILEIIEMERVGSTEIAKWLQIISAYTNQYPKYAIVNYLYVNNLDTSSNFVKFLESITRYIYYQGSTSTVKFEIYSIIKNTSLGKPIGTYKVNTLPVDFFDYLGRLKYGFALLAFYLNAKNALPKHNVDKIINLKDKQTLPKDWQNVNLDEVVDSLGNIVVLDIPKRSLGFNKKIEYFGKSKIAEVSGLFANGAFTYTQYLRRDTDLKQRLISFFS